MKKSISDITKLRALQLRRQQTPAEKRLWCKLSAKQLLGLHVRRQHPIGPYIADFYIDKIKLVIEVDGYTHDFRLEKDEFRDQYMKEQGYKVIRVRSQDVMVRIEDVVEYIRLECEKRLSRSEEKN